MHITKAIEDYLEALYLLEKDEKKVQSTQVARMLNVSKPAVNKAMNDLKEKSFILKDDYGKIVLTEEGRKIASSVYGKHEAIKNFLLAIGVSQENALNDCCKIEHVISDETLDCLIKTTKLLKIEE